MRQKVYSILFLLLCGLTANKTNAQISIVDTATMHQVLQNTGFIFEGTVESQCTYQEPSTGEIYTTNFIRISKIVKGQALTCGIVPVVTRGGAYGDTYLDISHTTALTQNFTGLFFCTYSPYPSFATTCAYSGSNPVLTTIVAEHSLIEYYSDQLNAIAEGYNSEFATLTDLYNFIQTDLGITITNCGYESIIEPFIEAAKNRPSARTIPVTFSTGKTTKTTSSNDLYYTFSGEKITGTTTKYFECDVEIEGSNDSTYLDEAAFRIKYNSLAFGTNIATPMTVTLGAAFPATTYTTVQKIDKASNVVSIWIHQAASGQPRTKILLTKQIFVHLKIPFISCQEFPIMTLDTFATVLDYSFFTTAATAASSSAVAYDYVDLSETDYGTSCAPDVVSVASLSSGTRNVAGGIKEQIQIIGKHFGPNNGKLYMQSADDNGTWLQLQNYDVSSWNDTNIIFTLPSIIDSIGGGTTVQTPGSGEVGIKNKWNGISDTTLVGGSPTRLNVKYSASNNSRKIPSYHKEHRVLASAFTDSSYTFHLHTSVPTPMRECIVAAVNRWRCLTGVNFKVHPTPTTDTTKDDKKCVIMVKAFAVKDSLTIAGTKSRDTSCISSVGKPFAIKEIDMEINASYLSKFFYDTTGTINKPALTYDFFALILHELGHGHQQKHVRNTFDVMYWSQNNYFLPVLSSDRVINLKYDNQQGGDWVMQKSTDLTSYGFTCVYNIPIAMQDTACRLQPTGIKTLSSSTNEVSIFPNPSNDKVQISVQSQTSQKWQVLITSVQGVTVGKYTISNNSPLEISTSNWASGLYIVQLNNGKETIVKKLLCAH